MSQVRMHEILKTIRSDWGEESPQYRICVAILEHIVSYPAANHLTYGSLRQLLQDPFADEQFLTAIQYLCGDRTHLLDLQFEFIDDDEDVFPLKRGEVREAERDGFLVHPGTGEVMKDFANNVLIFFEPSRLAREIIKEH